MSDSLSLRHQVGQLLLAGFEGTELSPMQKCMLRSFQPGGIILFARNIQDARQTHALNRAASREGAVPLFHCIDMEGGTVDRLKAVFAPAPSARAVSSTGNKKLFLRHGELIGKETRALGFNVDFAPVLDLDLPRGRSVLGSRTAGADPKQVVSYARSFLDGLKAATVHGCGKHFPGLGDGSLDSHHELPKIERSADRLWKEDLYPYRALRKRMPFVMVAHAAYPAVTGDNVPASLSRYWIRKILRGKIGFNGIVVSDDLEMDGVLSQATIEEAAVATIAAGTDMFLVCRNDELVWRAYEAVLREAEKNRKFRTRIADSVKRILRFKKKAPGLRSFPLFPDDATVARLRGEVQAFREKIASMQAGTAVPIGAGAGE